MSDQYDAMTAHHSNRLPPRFAILDPILSREAKGIIEHAERIIETQPVLPLIGIVLRLIPLEDRPTNREEIIIFW